MNGSSTTYGRLRPSSRGRAFTLLELLVVIGIIALLLAIAVPAFSSLLYSSTQSLAENALRSGLNAARDTAARSGRGRDAAAVFFFEPGGRLTIVACVSVGSITDLASDPFGAGTIPKVREFFAPLPTIDPVQLPRGWSVRGYAAANTIDNDWYERTYPDDSRRLRAQGNWVFPETGFYDQTQGTDGANRQSFMVRFEGGTGRLRTDATDEVLVLSPAPTAGYRTTGVFSRFRVDREPDPLRFASRIIAAPTVSVAGSTATVIAQADKRQLLGDESSDTVLAKSVSAVSLYNEDRLASALNVRLDGESQTIYRFATPAGPALVSDRSGGPVDIDQANQWLEGRLRQGGRDVDTDARIFTIQRYLGWLQEFRRPGGRGGV